ncbi:MAG: general stress protein CsbD [Planctomycetes bacterium]|nr:general stress protein CsbD [Planctomycetota bacterium]
MNWAQIQRDWQGMGPLLKTYWPKLTDVDLEQVKGRRDDMVASLQGLYGYGKEEAERALAIFEKEVRFPGAVK